MENNQVIGSTQFTQNSIIDILIEKDANFRQSVENSAIKEITTTFNNDAQGFISYVHILKIELQNGQIFEYALKFPSIEYLIDKGENSQDDIQKIAQKNKILCLIHNLECQFYNLFSGNSCPIPIPKVFFIKPAESSFEEGLIVMKNLAKEGMVFKKYEFLDEEKIWVIIEHIARFQAFLLHNQEKIQWKGRFLECDYPNVNLRKRLEKLKTVFPGQFEKVIEGLYPVIEDKKLHQYWLWECCEDLGIPMVLCHGDLWATNIFWRKNQEGMASNELIGFIDWSLTFEDEQEKIEIQHVVKNIEEALIDAVNLLKNGYF
uniref:CHK kinase-like domain-containing protein n=1 Tax=Acrobeloides nanus TaxID=290746 RepID=A0A914D157_9BILA